MCVPSLLCKIPDATERMGMNGNSHGEELFAPEEAGDISLEDVFTACMDCRRKKRGTYNVLAFAVDW